MNNRDLLLEFIQWCVDNPALAEDMLVDPLVAIVSVDEFLNVIGEDDTEGAG